MRLIEVKGRSIEEAVNAALLELEADRSEVSVEVLEEGSKGLFGILGAREARVKVAMNRDKCKYVTQLMETIASKMGVRVDIKVIEKTDGILVQVMGDKAGTLIGRRGQVLDALQYVLNLAATRDCDDHRRIMLDVEGYRKRRQETLERLAMRLAERVRRTGQSVILEPMNSQERKVVHTVLQNNLYVNTHSEGEEPYRKIIISCKR